MKLISNYLFLLLALSLTTLEAQKVKVSSFGFEDPSKALKMAMRSAHDTLIIDFQSKPWILKPLRFEGFKDKTIIVEPGVEIVAKKGAFPKRTDALFKFLDCENIHILGNDNVFRMNKEEYLDGEWRHVIRIKGCKNVSVRNLTLRDSGGDGITIGGTEKNNFSQNIRISNIKSLNNKRQGISIISAKDVYISNSLFAETKGTLPGAGLDIEPNVATDVIGKITFEHCEFKDNFNAGIKVALGELRSFSHPVDIRFKNCVVSNNYDPECGKDPAQIVLKSNKLDPVKGNVLFENCTISDSKWSFLYAKKHAEGYQVRFVDCVAKNICQDGDLPAIYLNVTHFREPVDIGGYSFENLYLEMASKEPVITVMGSRRGTLKHLRDLKGNITVSGAGENFDYINYNPSENQNVELQIIKKQR